MPSGTPVGFAISVTSALEGIESLMEPARKLGPAIGVDQLAAEIPQLASSHQLVVVPATPVSKTGWNRLVVLSNDDLSAADFCKLAADAGATLLYVQADRFSAVTDPDLNVGARYRSKSGRPVTGRLAEFRRDAEHFDGRIHQLELAFVTGCVLHCWAVAADWYIGLVDRAAGLFP
jgi:catechol 2,3-dioxygenase-like lactoylglutathione lyase family enzyme